MVAMVTDMCRSVPKRIFFYKLQHKVTILKNSLTSFEKCMVSMKKLYKYTFVASEMVGWGHKLALKVLLVGTKVWNYP